MSKHFVDAEEVALSVFEPGSLLRPEDADVVHRLESGEIVVFELHSARGQLLNHFRGVGNLEADRGVLRLGGCRFRQQSDQPAGAREEILPVARLAEVGQAEDVSVELSRAVSVDYREN